MQLYHKLVKNADAARPGGRSVRRESLGMPPASGPTRPGERILEIDVLRGLALLGLLLVNMDGFAWPLADYRLGWSDTAALWDRVAGWGIRFLAEGKFFPMFSFLFGFGLAMQMARAEARGARFSPQYLRRVFWLFLFGALHVAFLWFGDILTAYAVLGAALLLFRRRRAKTLLAWACACIVLSLVITMGWYSLASFIPADESEVVTQQAIARALQVYGQGSYQDIARQRLRDFALTTAVGTASLPVVFAMFLIGLLAGREGLFRDVPARLPVFRRTARWGLAIGVLATLIGVVGHDLAEVAGGSGIEGAAMIGDGIGGPGRPDAADQLPHAVGHLHDHLLRLRPGFLWEGRRGSRRRAGGLHPHAAGVVEHQVVPAL